MMNDSIADRDSELALIMAMSSASVEEASLALDQCGDVDAAMAFLDNGATSTAGVTKQTVSKMIPVTAKRTPYTSTRASRSNSRRGGREDVDDDSAAKPVAAPRQANLVKLGNKVYLGRRQHEVSQESLRYSPKQESADRNDAFMHYKKGAYVENASAMHTNGFLLLGFDCN